MVPFLAPLLGSMAASLLPATFGTGVAGALGMSGAAGGLLAAAAPKAIGAGIGTLLAGGDMGDAALNAVGFGAAGAAGNALSSMLSGSPQAAAAAAGTTGAATSPVTAPAAAAPQMNMQQLAGLLQGGQQAPAAMPMPAPQASQGSGSQASQNPMLAAGTQPQPSVAQMASTTVPSVGGSSMMPASVGIGTLPNMNNDAMMAGFSPDQRKMVSGYLGSQGMRGFA